ncbi:MAG: NADPH-dependent FMN reductase [Pseudomonadota bacterium]
MVSALTPSSSASSSSSSFADVRLLVTAGSSRRGSYNMQLARWVAAQATAAGAQVTLLDLQSLQLPLYDADLEAEGMPAGALTLRQHFAHHEAFIVCAPEYNGFPTPLLINALDWASRPAADGALPSGIDAMKGTVAGLLGASPGGLGGLRGLVALRSFLQMNLGMLIVPEQHALGSAMKAFDAEGQLSDARQQEGVHQVVRSVLRTTAALVSSNAVTGTRAQERA